MGGEIGGEGVMCSFGVTDSTGGSGEFVSAGKNLVGEGEKERIRRGRGVGGTEN